MGRYSLVMKTFDKQTIKINFLEKNKLTNKVSLKTIDKYTTTTSSIEELLKKINSDKEIESIKITYVKDKHIWQVPVAYSDKNKLNEIDLKDGSHIGRNNRVFNNTMSKLMELLKDHDFYIFAMKSDLLTSKQKEYIEIIFVGGKYSDFNKSKLYSYSDSYRQFRDILFLIEKYEMIELAKQEGKPVIIEKNDDDDYKDVLLDEEEKRKYQQFLIERYEMIQLANKEEKPVIIEEIDDEDDYEDVLFDKEEKEEYQRYLDNLPDNLPPYIDHHL